MTGTGTDRGARDGLWDPGLQPERTAFAWQRTVLAMTVAAVVAARLVAPVLGWEVFPVVTAGAGLAGVVAGVADRRAQVRTELLHHAGDLADGPGGAVLAATATTVAVTALAAAVFVIG